MDVKNEFFWSEKKKRGATPPPRIAKSTSVSELKTLFSLSSPSASYAVYQAV